MKLITIISILACCSVSLANQESGGKLQASAVYVDFRSTGGGIDVQSLNAYEQLYQAASSRGEVVESTTVQTGHEGEVRHCVQMQDAMQRYYFIQSLSFGILLDRQQTGTQRTAVYVGFDCHSFDSATEQDLSKSWGQL